VQARIKVIADFPAKLKKEVDKLKGDMLEYRHRLGGWTIRALIHHCAAAYMHMCELNWPLRKKIHCKHTVKVRGQYDDAGGAPVEWSYNYWKGCISDGFNVV